MKESQKDEQAIFAFVEQYNKEAFRHDSARLKGCNGPCHSFGNRFMLFAYFSSILI